MDVLEIAVVYYLIYMCKCRLKIYRQNKCLFCVTCNMIIVNKVTFVNGSVNILLAYSSHGCIVYNKVHIIHEVPNISDKYGLRSGNAKSKKEVEKTDFENQFLPSLSCSEEDKVNDLNLIFNNFFLKLIIIGP